MSFVYLAWCTKVLFACLIWSPRKNCNSPIIDISNFCSYPLQPSQPKSETSRQRQYHPRIPKQIGYHHPAWGEKESYIPCPSQTPCWTRTPSNGHIKHGELVSAHTTPFSAYTPHWETQNSQSPVVATHKLPPLETHTRRHSSHPFGTIWTH
jgi:hypothetical protein